MQDLSGARISSENLGLLLTDLQTLKDLGVDLFQIRLRTLEADPVDIILSEDGTARLMIDND